MADETDTLEQRLLADLEDGLPLTATPYADLAGGLGVAEQTVIALLETLQENGTVSRFGVVVRHRELGYHANAMVVWDVPDHEVSRVGTLFADLPFVTLCYRRPRRLPQWPYNLFCMIHGTDRDEVLRQVKQAAKAAGMADCPRDALFSGRRFKQRGARYGKSGKSEAAA